MPVLIFLDFEVYLERQKVVFLALPSLPIRIIEFIILCIVLHFEKNSLNSNGSFDFINTQFGLAQNPVQENLFVNIFVSPKLLENCCICRPYGEIIGHYFGHVWTMSEISRIPGQIL